MTTALTGVILVVDDNEDNRVLLARRLERHGHIVTMAENGIQAMAQLRTQPFDLVLLDIMMPEMDGYELLGAVKNDTALRHIPVIMISAVDDISSIVRCIELGAEDYLFKPFNPVLLRARVGASLERKRLRDHEQAYLRAVEEAQDRSERLLLNILPAPIAARLMYRADDEFQALIADSFRTVTVMFADIVDFTQLTENTPPSGLVMLLNTIFSLFDDLAEQHGLEKIKTIGDAYMVVGGLPLPRPDHAIAVAEMALAIQEVLPDLARDDGAHFQVRIGIHSGPVIAGVIGKRKFSYDLWGDTVNIASRMESHGLPGTIQVTEAIYTLLHDHYTFEERGLIPVKGKGEMMAYLLTGRR